MSCLDPLSYPSKAEMKVLSLPALRERQKRRVFLREMLAYVPLELFPITSNEAFDWMCERFRVISMHDVSRDALQWRVETIEGRHAFDMTISGLGHSSNVTRFADSIDLDKGGHHGNKEGSPEEETSPEEEGGTSGPR